MNDFSIRAFHFHQRNHLGSDGEDQVRIGHGTHGAWRSTERRLRRSVGFASRALPAGFEASRHLVPLYTTCTIAPPADKGLVVAFANFSMLRRGGSTEARMITAQTYSASLPCCRAIKAGTRWLVSCPGPVPVRKVVGVPADAKTMWVRPIGL